MSEPQTSAGRFALLVPGLSPELRAALAVHVADAELEARQSALDDVRREVLTPLAASLQWLQQNYPKAFVEMPAVRLDAITRADAILDRLSEKL